MATATVPPPDTPTIVPPQGDVLYEVVDGQIVELPPMGAYPSWVASLLAQSLGPFATTHQLGRVVVEMLFRIDLVKNLQRRPDVAFVSYERWPREQQVPEDAAWDVVPDLAIEVVSPSNTAEEILAKTLEYFRKGVRRVWVVYPKSSVVVVHETADVSKTLKGGDELDGGEILPGFRTSVASLFQ